jgi:hypothetical protein
MAPGQDNPGDNHEEDVEKKNEQQSHEQKSHPSATANTREKIGLGNRCKAHPKGTVSLTHELDFLSWAPF